jgi:deoxyribonuclease IV
MIRLGTAGAFGFSYSDACTVLKKHKLHAMEVEFTYGVHMKKEDAMKLKSAASENNIHLSVHAPYYVNLASLEYEKIENSKKRILAAAERADDMGAKYVVFHAGFYHKRDPQVVYQIIKDQVSSLVKEIKKKKFNVKLCPETTGKESQFGSLQELLRLMEDTGCHICIDFSHIYARQLGTIDYDAVMQKITHIDHVHAHFSGIEYTAKGEKRHIPTQKAFIEPFLTALVKHNINITIINESPDMFNDTIMTQKLLEELGKLK